MRTTPLPTLLLLCASGAWAADPAPRVLDTIEVVGGKRATDTWPGSVSVLDATALRDGQRAVNLSESLQRVPGFTALDRQNYAQDLQVQSRGFGARSTFGIRGIRLVVDGIPASAADGQGQAAGFPLSSLDRIEVLRGPLALQYGNAAGGAIVAHSVLDAPPGVALDAWAGGDASRRAALRADGGDAGDAWRWRAQASAFATDGARAQSAARRNQFGAIGQWTARQGDTWRVVYNGLRQSLAEDPLGLTRADYDADAGRTDPAAIAFDTRKRVREDQAGLRWRRERDAGEAWASAYGSARAVEQFLAVPPAAQRAAGSAGGVIDLHRAASGLDAGRRWRGARGTLALGVELAHLDERRRGYENFIGPDTAPTRQGVRGRLRRDERNRVRALDLYAAADARAGEDWTLSLGARRAWLRFDSRDLFLANGEDSGGMRRTGTAFSLGAVRAFDRGEVFASAGRGFETPTLTELAYRPDGGAGFNRGLAPSRADALEVGARWRGARVAGSFALYRVEGRGEIVPALNRGGRASFANAGATRRDGVELGLSGATGTRGTYALAASWIDARFSDGFAFAVANGAQLDTRIVAAGNRIPGIPRADVFAEWAWRSGDGRWSGAVEGRWLGAIATDDRNTDAAAGHGRIALRGRWRAADAGGWHVFARIDNLLDRRYVGSVIVNEGNGRWFEPGAGRGVTVGIGWDGRRGDAGAP